MQLDVETIDLRFGREELVSSHLLTLNKGGPGAERYALVDVGSPTNIPHLLKALDARGVDYDRVEFVFLTHIHLDHAGGAGLLVNKCLKNAQVVVHQNGSKHLADPSRLEAGARAVYGDEVYDRVYGPLQPVPMERQCVVTEGSTIPFGDALVLDTPGHARHHYCLWFEENRSVFAGDTFGVSYPWGVSEFGPFIYPTTTPSAFEPERLVESVRRIAALNAEYAYLTHFGQLPQPSRYASDLVRRIEDLCDLARHGGVDLEALQLDYARKELTEHRVTDIEGALELLKFDIALNTQGLLSWKSRLSE
jgi:glyoxylase-like metal-dependent hydrolase (beta-lactamase superfamily II)